MNRRTALQNFGAAAALFGVPARSATKQGDLPPAELRTKDADAYWTRVRSEQFLLADWRAYLNNGSLGVAPKPVLQAVANYMERAAALTEDEYPRWGYETLDKHRETLANFAGCKKDELAIMHSATEAMSTVAAGIDLKSGDEVVITDQEHPSGKGCWYLRQARHGIKVRRGADPDASRQKPRRLSTCSSLPSLLTHEFFPSAVFSTTTGLVMPVREICEAARRKGVITVVDRERTCWANTDAHLRFGLRLLRRESTQVDVCPRWIRIALRAPGECRPPLANNRNRQLGRQEASCCALYDGGTSNRAVVEGPSQEFSSSSPSAKAPSSTGSRTGAIRPEASREYPYVELLTPDDDRTYGGLVTVRFRNKDLTRFREECRKRRIWIYGGDLLRVATHIHTRRKDLDALFSTMRDTLG